MTISAMKTPMLALAAGTLLAGAGASAWMSDASAQEHGRDTPSPSGLGIRVERAPDAPGPMRASRGEVDLLRERVDHLERRVAQLERMLIDPRPSPAVDPIDPRPSPAVDPTGAAPMAATSPDRARDRAGGYFLWVEPKLQRAAREDRARDLAGEYFLELPAGHIRKIQLIEEGPGRYRFLPRELNFAGTYEVRGDRLVIVDPQDERLSGFEWRIGESGGLTLVAQPDVSRTGSDYLGAEMHRREPGDSRR